MFNVLINFCVFVFIFYAVGNSARIIVFGKRRKKRRAYAHGKPARRRNAKVIKLNVSPAKKPLRKTPQRLYFIYNLSIALATPK